jgi:hypothetical protein
MPIIPTLNTDINNNDDCLLNNDEYDLSHNDIYSSYYVNQYLRKPEK